ncbi:MAG: formylglycine-generating enzyme family protein [Acidobacteriaceae bacterium]|nr:formylglycine-generating enzyme family protein [Acidobacteriaceae bacterium]MBV9503339.1 formylglycine-generating enzyme family protein [Acidobacteriaceae bacterium]
MPATCWAGFALATGLCYAAGGLAASTGGQTVGSHVAGQSFRDCNDYCPEMIVVPPGRFTIGSPISEAGRGSDENPQRVVTIAYALAVGKYPVTRREFAAFVEDSRRKLGPCEHWDGKSFQIEEGVCWSNVFHQTDQHPVVCVNWDDSQAYVQWLSRKTGKRYRLLSEAEWEYAARAGTTTAWYWGGNESDQCRYANGADLSAKAQGVTTAGLVTCEDKYSHTSPVGSFRPNKFGLYDMAGNVGEWVEDCYHNAYRDTPADGSAVESCMPRFHNARVMRGGAWNAIPAWLRSASRDVEVPSLRADTFGFRVARDD